MLIWKKLLFASFHLYYKVFFLIQIYTTCSAPLSVPILLHTDVLFIFCTSITCGLGAAVRLRQMDPDCAPAKPVTTGKGQCLHTRGTQKRSSYKIMTWVNLDLCIQHFKHPLGQL